MPKPAFDLLPKSVQKVLPALYSQDGKGLDATAYVKVFFPVGGYTAFITEGDFDADENDWRLFGQATMDGTSYEWGYFSLNEMKSVVGPLGLKIERDIYFTPKPMREALPAAAIARQGGK